MTVKTSRQDFAELRTYRQVHLVDVDNLTRGPTQDLAVHQQVRRWYDTASQRRVGDLCFVAMSHYSAFPTSLVWAGAKLYWRSGPDGADHALIDALDEIQLSGVDRVCLGSGDTIFRYALWTVREIGCPVTVVCPECSLSTGLTSVADDLLVLPTPGLKPETLQDQIEDCRSKSWVNREPVLPAMS
jgi:hypothetical protein